MSDTTGSEFRSSSTVRVGTEVRYSGASFACRHRRYDLVLMFVTTGSEFRSSSPTVRFGTEVGYSSVTTGSEFRSSSPSLRFGIEVRYDKERLALARQRRCDLALKSLTTGSDCLGVTDGTIRY